MELIVKHTEGETKVSIERRGAEYTVQVGDKSYVILSAEAASGVRSLLVEGDQYEVAVRNVGEDRYEIASSAGTETVQVRDPLTHLAETTHSASAAGGRKQVEAYMPGRVVDVLVEEGATVKQGQGIVVLEAMKMENEIQADRDGVVSKILVYAGQPVEGGDPLFEIE